MSAERRRHPRITLGVDVDISSGSNFYAGRMRDLSVGGLFIELSITPEVGTEVEIALSLGKRKFSLPARCAWVLSGPEGAAVGFGAEFVSLAPRVRTAILKFMKSREPLAFDMLEDVDEDDEEQPPASDRPDDPSRGGPPPLPNV